MLSGDEIYDDDITSDPATILGDDADQEERPRERRRMTLSSALEAVLVGHRAVLALELGTPEAEVNAALDALAAALEACSPLEQLAYLELARRESDALTR